MWQNKDHSMKKNGKSSYCLFLDSESESDSDLESQDGIFYSVYEQKQRHKKKQLLESNNLMGQSKVVLKATVMQGMLNLYSPVRVGTNLFRLVLFMRFNVVDHKEPFFTFRILKEMSFHDNMVI